MSRKLILGLALTFGTAGALLWALAGTERGPSLAEAQALTPVTWSQTAQEACTRAPSRDCLLTWALAETRRVQPQGSDLLASIAVAWDRPELLTEAKAAAQESLAAMPVGERLEMSSLVLGNVAAHEIELGLVERGLETLSEIGDQRGRELAGSILAGDLVEAGAVSTALEIAEDIGDARLRASALGRVIAAQIRDGDIRPAQETMAQLRALPSPGSGEVSLALLRVVKALMKSGQDGIALETAQGIGVAYYRALALAGLGASERRADLIQAAVQAARAAPNARMAQRSLVEVASLAAEAGEGRLALSLLAEIPPGGDRPRASAQVARGLAKAGWLPEALDLARGIEDGLYRAGAVAGIAEAQARPDMPSRLSGLLRGLGDAAHDEAWRAIAGALAKEGEKAAAIDAASNIRKAPRLIQTLASIAVLVGDSAVLDPTIGMLSFVSDPRERSICLGALAVAQAELGMVMEAAAAAAQIANPETRIGALVMAANRFAPRRQTLEPGLPIEEMPTNLPGPGVFYAQLP